MQCATGEAGVCSLPAGASAAVFYGINGRYVYLTGLTGAIACKLSTFGSDPDPGIVKNCYAVVTPPAAAHPCAIDYGTCALPAGATATVYYGVNGSFFYKSAATGSVSCVPASFGGDPAPGVVKTCAAFITALPPSVLPCAGESAVCALPPGTTATVFYGAGASYTYRTGQTGSIACDVGWFVGDPDPGVVKACYAKANVLPGGAVTCASGGGTCVLPAGSLATVYYGTGSSYAYATGKSGSVACSTATFGGDPDPNVVKSCLAVVSSLPPGAVVCAVDAGTCALEKGVTTTVYYGAGISYAYKTGLSGSVACNTATFGGDPDPNVVKGCYAVEPAVSALPPAAASCAAQGATCSVPAGALATVYFGTGSSYYYAVNQSGNVLCNTTSFGGDPDPGAVKSCFALVTRLPAGSMQCAGESGTCALATGVTATVFYGAGASYGYRLGQSGSLGCNPTTFGGDPDVNIVKACYATANTLPGGAVSCGPDGGTCSLPAGAVATVFYGAGTSFAFRGGQSGTVGCNAAIFGGDPDPGVAKTCYAIVTSLPAGLAQCAADSGTCVVPGASAANVYYGAGNSYTYKTGAIGSVGCNAATFGGDPDINVAKACYLTPVQSVNLAPYFNVAAISTDTAQLYTSLYNLSGAPYTYSINAIGGSSIPWNGSVFNLGPADANDAVTNAVVALPAGNFGRLDILASRAYGSNAAETFIVTYTDGTTSSFTQGMSDWWNNANTGANFPGESTALFLSYLHNGTNATAYGQPASIFGYSFALNAAKTVKSVALPPDTDVGVLAMNLGPALAPPAIPAAGAAQAVLTHHNDTWRTGDNPAEYQLTPATVGNITGTNVFGRLGTIALDGQVDAQPLVVPKIAVTGDPNAGTHDVVYVATENNTVYAIDPVAIKVLASRNLGSAVNNPIGFGQGIAGIRGTPVIDAAKGALYVVAYVQASSGPVYQLHMLSLSTLADMVPAATIGASASLFNGTVFAFNATYEMQRPALLEANGMIVVAFGSWGDLGANLSRGWVLRFDANTLALIAGAVNLLDSQSSGNSYDMYLSSVWMSGAGPAADESGNIYFSTGNSSPGTYDGVTSLQESVVKLAPATGQVLSLYTPNNVDALDQADDDVGSGGVLLLPNANKHVGAILSKDAIVRVFSRDNLGGNNDANLVAAVPGDACWCALSYFNDGQDRLVTSGGNVLRVFSWQTATTPVLVPSGTAQAPGGQAPGAVTSISQGATANGIIWVTPHALNFPASGENLNLMAFQAQPVNGVLPLLYLAPAGTWDYGGGGSDNNPPTVANGRVYVASYKELVIFGFGGKR